MSMGRVIGLTDMESPAADAAQMNRRPESTSATAGELAGIGGRRLLELSVFAALIVVLSWPSRRSTSCARGSPAPIRG